MNRTPALRTPAYRPPVFRTAAVIGAGTIGLSWTALFAAHGLTVRVSDPREDLAEQTALQWQAIVRTVREQAAALGPAYTEVRYEELCARPRQTYRALFRFAGLLSEDAALAGIPEKLDESESWRRSLSPEQLATIEKAAGELLRELGYL